MKITSRASDYGLLLLLYLAKLPLDETASIKKIAEFHHLSIRFLANIANKLTMARIVLSHRGLGGGVKLARPSDSITVRQVIEAVDGPVQTMFCQNSDENCSHEVSCNMKHFWDDIQNSVMSKLTNTTIADLITTQGPGGQKIVLPQHGLESTYV
jgi:Rrf2 family protein